MASSSTVKPIQHFYPDELSRCFGCGRLNTEGHRLESRWEGDEMVARFTPLPSHIAVPGYVYGGLLASLIDCHGTGIGAAAGYRDQGREPGTEPPLRYVTASLKVDYLKPTPMGVELELRGKPVEVKGRKVRSEIRLLAGGVECVRGEVVAVQVPEGMLKPKS